MHWNSLYRCLRTSYLGPLSPAGDILITGDLFKLVHLGNPRPERHPMVASETETRTVSNWAVRFLLECFLVFVVSETQLRCPSSKRLD